MRGHGLLRWKTGTGIFRRGISGIAGGSRMTVGRLGLQRAVLAFIVGVAMLVLPQTPLSAEPSALASRLETLLKEGGYKSLAKVNDAVWTLDFNGKRLAKFRVIVTLSEKESSGIIVAFANPVSKGQLPKNNTKLLTLLLKANYDFDYVKIGIDNDGDLFVRADLPPDTDLPHFKSVIEQVAAATDDLYGKILPLLQ